MSDPQATMDVLEVLASRVERLLEALRGASDTAYVQGQLAYLEALDERLGDVPAEVRPRDLLEEVAEEQGLAFTGTELEAPPADQHEAGVLSMWSLCLGFVEGAVVGARAVTAAIEEAPPPGEQIQGENAD